LKTTDYRFFGRTGINVSPLTLGCMTFGWTTELPESIRIIDRALEAGINILDTANVYSRGRSEEFTGEALKKNGRRGEVFLCTKVQGGMPL
jgi:aryl-alcohol dehydrogenase-like predicted oxidoreductase